MGSTPKAKKDKETVQAAVASEPKKSVHKAKAKAHKAHKAKASTHDSKAKTRIWPTPLDAVGRPCRGVVCKCPLIDNEDLHP